MGHEEEENMGGDVPCKDVLPEFTAESQPQVPQFLVTPLDCRLAPECGDVIHGVWSIVSVCRGRFTTLFTQGCRPAIMGHEEEENMGGDVPRKDVLPEFTAESQPQVPQF